MRERNAQGVSRNVNQKFREMKCILIASAVFPALICANLCQAQAPFTSDLVMYLPFNGNALDASGHTNNGTLIGSVTPATDRFGIVSNCYRFNGMPLCEIEVTNNPLFNIGQAGYAISCWFALDNAASTQNEILFNTIPETGLGYAYTGTDIGYAIGAANGSWTATGLNGHKTNYANGVWCQYVFVKSGTTYTTYVNGVVDSAYTNSAAAGFNAAVTGIIGGITPINTPYNQTFIGRMDDFRIYDRALSSNEVQELLNYETYVEDCTPHGAMATAIVTNGFVVGANITDQGCGYTNTPEVVIVGGGGTGATAVAVQTNGYISGITITATGSGYTTLPDIYISYSPVTIVTQPLTQIISAGSNVTFSVGASGTPPLSYQWYLSGTNLVGATNSSLTVSNITQTNLGIYTVDVMNPFGFLTSSGAALDMPPYLAQPFAGLVTNWGASSVLSVGAWGTGPLSYQWYDDGIAIEGATNQTLALNSIQFTNAGAYSVVVSDAFGSVSNVPEQVVVNPAGVSLRLSPTLLISGTVGYSFTIQSTTDLSNTNSWDTLSTVTLTQPTQFWFDTNQDASQPGNATHFYRVLPNQ